MRSIQRSVSGAKTLETYSWGEYLIPLLKGLKVTPKSESHLYAGVTMEIIDADFDQSNPSDSMIKFRLSEKVRGRRYTTARMWWLLGETSLVREEAEG